MEVSYRVMSLYLYYVFFSFGAHRKLVNGADFELFIHFPYSCCQYCNRQFYINILSFRLIVLIRVPLALVVDQGEYGWFRLDAFKLLQSIPRVFRGRRFKG